MLGSISYKENYGTLIIIAGLHFYVLIKNETGLWICKQQYNK